MNSRERFIAVMEGRQPDRTPLACVTACTTIELQESTGCFMPYVHTDPERLARLCAANHEVLNFDAVTFIINYFNEPAALGVEMEWGRHSTLPMFLSHPWKQISDAVFPDDFLQTEPVLTCLESIRTGKAKYGDQMAVLGKIMGPLSFVQVMHGIDETMTAVLLDPGKIEKYLEFAVNILSVFANAQIEAGADAISIGEGGAGANMLSPELHEKILQKHHKRLVDSIHGYSIMHICGNILPRANLLASTNISCFNFDWSVNPGAIKSAIGEKMLLMGNISALDLLSGSPEIIERQVFACLEAGIDIISPGCAISPECPNENLLAMSKAIAEWEVNRNR